MCAAVPVRALLQLPLLGVERGYKGLYGGGWPLRGMGAAGTALGAADARTNEHYEIGTILTQFLHCGSISRTLVSTDAQTTLKGSDIHAAASSATAEMLLRQESWKRSCGHRPRSSLLSSALRAL